WPSGDTAAVRALSLRGFAPLVAVAARPRGASRPPDDPRVRPVTPADLEDVARLYEALVAYDAQFGWVTPRPSTPARIREHLADTLPRSWAWVAEHRGAVAGVVIVDPPARSRWVASLVTRTPAAYLGVMYAHPAVRGRGVGAALAAAAHARLDASGVAVTVLHHAVPNPLSAPFWARQGYRPVFTQWVRR
ncbi:GNAT family N-acetyltransferase, partial [Nonomuraea sp. MCN248]